MSLIYSFIDFFNTNKKKVRMVEAAFKAEFCLLLEDLARKSTRTFLYFCVCLNVKNCH